MQIRSRILWVADTLSGRLTLAFALLVLPPTIFSIYLAWDSFLEHTARAKLQVRQFATLTATYESKFFDDVRKTLRQVADEQGIRDGANAGCGGAIAAAAEKTPEFASLGYFDPMGQRICGSNEDLADISNSDWLSEVGRFRGFTISDYTVTPHSAEPVIVAAQAVYASDGHFQGVLAASIRLYWLSAFIREISLPAESVFYLVDSNGNILADRAVMANLHSGSGKTGPTSDTALGSLTNLVGQRLAAAILSRRVSDFETTGADHVRQVFSSVALPHGDATVLFGLPAVSAFGWLEQDLINRVLGLAAIWCAGIGAAWIGTRYLVIRWTGALQGMARSFGRGNYSEMPNFANAPRELRELGETLSLMARRIEAREEELKTSLHQKDMVLREIHHRVKNNLQIVSSLLNIRGGGVTGTREQAALKEVKAHVRALALVHRHLYESDDIARVDLRSFMTELCRSTLTGLSGSAPRISLDINIPEFHISTDRAIPIALLVTEAMTNSLKHAFPNGRAGRITVSLVQDGPHSGTLVVSDNGVGMPPSTEGGRTSGLGLQLMEAFAKQIGGSMTIGGPPGTVIRVTFDDAAGAAGELPDSDIGARANETNAA